VGSSEQPLSEGLVRKTVRSTVWTFGGQQATTVLALATSIAIGRLTDPSELGRYALASGIAQLVSTASTLQAGGYYVVSPEADARLLRTGLTLELSLGAALFTVTAGAGLVYGALQDDFGFSALLIASALVMLTNPFNSLDAWFSRRFAYRVPTVAKTACLVLSSVLKIALLFAGMGAWALVIGDVVVSAAYGLAMLVLIRDGRGFALDRAYARRQLNYGIPSLAIGAMSTATVRGQDFIVAGVLGTKSLGFYYLASRLPNQVYQLARSLSMALLPAFSRAEGDRLARAYALVTRYSAFLILFPLALAVPLAGPAIRILYGPQWEPATEALVLLMAAFSVRFVFWHLGNLMKSRNRVRELTPVILLQLVATMVACYFGARWFGLQGTAAAVLVVEVILVAPKVRLIRSVIPFDPRTVLAEPVAAFAISAAIAAAAAAWLPDAAAFAVGALGSTAIFAAAAIHSDRAFLQQLIASLRRAPRSA
jgi:O-antigen/teichoic acid export membrane protein